MAQFFRKKKKAKLSSAEDVLQSLLQKSNSPLSKQFLLWQVRQQWPKIVGEIVARQSEPVAYRNGFLYLWVKNSSVMQELSFISKELASKINQFSGKQWVKRVHFTRQKTVEFHSEVSHKGKRYLKANNQKK